MLGRGWMDLLARQLCGQQCRHRHGDVRHHMVDDPVAVGASPNSGDWHFDHVRGDRRKICRRPRLCPRCVADLRAVLGDLHPVDWVQRQQAYERFPSTFFRQRGSDRGVAQSPRYRGGGEKNRRSRQHGEIRVCRQYEPRAAHPAQRHLGLFGNHRRPSVGGFFEAIRLLCAGYPRCRHAFAEPNQRPAGCRQDRGRTDGNRSASVGYPRCARGDRTHHARTGRSEKSTDSVRYRKEYAHADGRRTGSKTDFAKSRVQCRQIYARRRTHSRLLHQNRRRRRSHLRRGRRTGHCSGKKGKAVSAVHAGR